MALYFHQQDWNVVATMRSPEQEQELTQLPNVLVTRLDVQDQDSINQAVAASLHHFGRLDVLANNAGYSVFGICKSSTPEQIRALFDVNLFGLMDVTRMVLPHLHQQLSHEAAQRMSWRGNCYDNAPAKSFWHRLKAGPLDGGSFPAWPKPPLGVLQRHACDIAVQVHQCCSVGRLSGLSERLKNGSG